MPTVHVALGERSYDIFIEDGMLPRLIEVLKPFDEVAILSNETVVSLYVQPLQAALRLFGKRVLVFSAPEGEQSKSLEWTSRAYDALAEFNLSRKGVIVAVGGGVVGDWAGFVAASWLRGVAFVQVPTTLLAAVDSSVGGKVGINHPRAKNLIGAFHQPIAVVMDPQTLSTLPTRELRAGLAEVIKYGVIADARFFAWLEENLEAALRLDDRVLEHIIARSCELKAEVVGEDERENDAIGRRAILNYGHTVGHAIEAVTSYGEFLHGEAIAIGMEVAARLAKHLDICENVDDLIARQTALFQRAGLPMQLPENLHFHQLYDAMLRDKKTRDGKLNFVLPTKLGHVERVEGVLPSAVELVIETMREKSSPAVPPTV
jgi:3-dehydroquinate synthase